MKGPDTVMATPFFDVVVAGAGPAGATTALSLARRGLSVALIDPCVENGVLAGESVPPIIRQLLTSLGVWKRFVSAGHRSAYTIRSAWGSHDPTDQNHIFHPYGVGWRVDRRVFDRMLVEAAVDAGVQLIRAAVGNASRIGDGWELEAGGLVRRCRYMVDATGRPARIARRLGAQRVALDRLVGVIATLPRERTTRADDGSTLIEAVPDGWWYSARTTDDRLLVAYMTDADLWERLARRPDGLAVEMGRAPLTRARMRGVLDVPMRVIAAGSSRLHPAAGAGWLAAGDAAMAVDPLSGSGICSALRSGMRAAEAISQEHNGDHAANQQYAAYMSRSFLMYEATWRWFYGSERRFPSSEFWKRRSSPTTGSHSYAGSARSSLALH